jgi:hypothetical protein
VSSGQVVRKKSVSSGQVVRKKSVSSGRVVRKGRARAAVCVTTVFGELDRVVFAARSRRAYSLGGHRSRSRRVFCRCESDIVCDTADTHTYMYSVVCVTEDTGTCTLLCVLPRILHMYSDVCLTEDPYSCTLLCVLPRILTHVLRCVCYGRSFLMSSL